MRFSLRMELELLLPVSRKVQAVRWWTGVPGIHPTTEAVVT